MKKMYYNLRRIFSKKNKIFYVILFIFIIGLISGSLYITMLNNKDKLYILGKITNYYSNYSKITLDDKLLIFKNSLINNILYIIIIWILGISVIGIPIVLILIFFKSFVLGFSISSIYAKYKLSSFLKIMLYLFPSNIIILIYTLFLSTFSILLSINLINSAFYKKSFNFGSFMGKYLFILLIGIIISIISSLIDAFIMPLLY